MGWPWRLLGGGTPVGSRPSPPSLVVKPPTLTSVPAEGGAEGPRGPRVGRASTGAGQGNQGERRDARAGRDATRYRWSFRARFVKEESGVRRE